MDRSRIVAVREDGVSVPFILESESECHECPNCPKQRSHRFSPDCSGRVRPPLDRLRSRSRRRSMRTCERSIGRNLRRMERQRGRAAFRRFVFRICVRRRTGGSKRGECRNACRPGRRNGWRSGSFRSRGQRVTPFSGSLFLFPYFRFAPVVSFRPARTGRFRGIP